MTLCGRKMIVAITGGIGAGKSVVSHMLRAMGMTVMPRRADSWMSPVR